MGKAFALFVKRLCLKEIRNAESLEPFVACGLIPLDKKPRLRPIGVREKLRRIAGKTAMILLKKMSCEQQGSYDYVEGNLPDLKPIFLMMIFLMMITRKVFY